jgi:hypothetical protein
MLLIALRWEYRVTLVIGKLKSIGTWLRFDTERSRRGQGIMKETLVRAFTGSEGCEGLAGQPTHYLLLPLGTAHTLISDVINWH